jgi:hypothetical protein
MACISWFMAHFFHFQSHNQLASHGLDFSDILFALSLPCVETLHSCLPFLLFKAPVITLTHLDNPG